MHIGVIAEDRSDIEVLYALTCKLVEPSAFSFKPFIGQGCGKIRRKCAAWAKNLLERGCSHLIVIHDLDTKVEKTLRRDITQCIRGLRFRGYIVLIPVREIESWLLADPEAIRKTFNLEKIPNIPKHPETILRPKEYLRDIVWKYGRKQYVNTIHNRRIADYVLIDRLPACASFSAYPPFVITVFHN